MQSPELFLKSFVGLLLVSSQLIAKTELRVELGGSTGEVASSEVAMVSASTTTAHGMHTGSVDFGTVTATSTIAINTTDGDPGLNAVSTFSDDITITSPGIGAFSRGVMVANVSLEGGLSVAPSGLSAGDSASGGAVYRFSLYQNDNPTTGFNGTPAINEQGRLDYDRAFSEEVTTTGAVPPNTSFEVEIPIKFGIPIQIRLEVLAAAFAALGDLAPEGASIQTSSDFSVGASWTGVKEVRHFSGTVLNDFSITTASGVDWLGIEPPPPPVYFRDASSEITEPDSLGERFLRFTVTRIKAAGELSYRIETSADMTEWIEKDPETSEFLAEIVALTPVDASLEKITVQDRQPIDLVDQKRFLRMVAILETSGE